MSEVQQQFLSFSSESFSQAVTNPSHVQADGDKFGELAAAITREYPNNTNPYGQKWESVVSMHFTKHNVFLESKMLEQAEEGLVSPSVHRQYYGTPRMSVVLQCVHLCR